MFCGLYSNLMVISMVNQCIFAYLEKDRDSINVECKFHTLSSSKSTEVLRCKWDSFLTWSAKEIQNVFFLEF